MSDRKFASFAEERRHMQSRAIKVEHQLISVRDKAQKLLYKMSDGGFGAEVDHLASLLQLELDESRKLVPPIMSSSICEHCGKSGELHKVKYEDDTGVGSMFVCTNCKGE